MFWIWFFVGLIVLSIIGIIVAYNSYDFEWMAGAGLAVGFISILILLCMICITFENKQSLSVFKNQSAYMETHIASSEIEDAALTAKKIELNDWLYSAQWAKDKFGIFSLYPDEVLNLEPIE